MQNTSQIQIKTHNPPFHACLIFQATLLQWLNQEVDPVSAFMQGLLVVTGDQMMVMKLAVMQPVLKEAQENATKGGTASTDAEEPELPGAAIFREASKLLTVEHVAQVQGVFQLDITQNGETVTQWVLDLKTGSGGVQLGAADDANTTVTLSEDTLMQWLNQEVDPVSAFMQGLLTVTGDQMMVMKLGVMQPILKQAQEIAARGGSAPEPELELPGASIFREASKLLTADHVAKVEGIFQLDVTKDDETVTQWVMDLKTGTGEVRLGATDDANTTVTLAEDTLVKWLNQEVDPVSAFMQGLLTVTGDQMMVMKLAVMQPILKQAQLNASGAVPPTPVTKEPTEASRSRALSFREERAARFRKAAQRLSGNLELQDREHDIVQKLRDMCDKAPKEHLTYMQIKRDLTAIYDESVFDDNEKLIVEQLKTHSESVDKLTASQEGTGNGKKGHGKKGAPAVKTASTHSDDAEVDPDRVLVEVNRLLTPEHVEKIAGVFRYDVTQGKYGQVVKQWTLDLKTVADGQVYPGPPKDGIEADVIFTLTEANLKKWLNDKLDPIYAYMTGKLKFKGDQKTVIKLNALKPLFKKACVIAKAPAEEVDDDELARRERLEAEWAEYQAEEKSRADAQALVLEEEAEQLNVKRKADAEERQESARLEAEQFAKAAAAEIGWETEDVTANVSDADEERRQKEDAAKEAAETKRKQIQVNTLDLPPTCAIVCVGKTYTQWHRQESAA